MYGKIFRQIYDSTLADDWQALITFQQFLILCDPRGVVDMTAGAIHRITGIPLEHIEAGIEKLEQPDPQSRSNVADGRRIVRLDDSRSWGWQIVNYNYYQNLVSREDKREKDRIRIAEKRRKDKDVADCSNMSPEVANVASVSVAVTTSVKNPNTTVPQAGPPEIDVVFKHWQKTLNHPQAKLTNERDRKIKNALKTYSASQLCKAIEGCAKTPHNMGHNDRNEVYDDISLILRDAAHIERFMRNADSPPRPAKANGFSGRLVDIDTLAKGLGLSPKAGESQQQWEQRVMRENERRARYGEAR